MTTPAFCPSPLKAPLALAALWLLTASLSALAVPLLMAAVPSWHEVRVHLQQLAVWQTWISVCACLGLLLLAKRRHAEVQEAWAQGALLAYVLGGMVGAIALNYGVLPQWLVNANALPQQLQMLGLMLLHWLCAWQTLRGLLQQRQAALRQA